MVEKLIICERCKGEGSVRKYIINDSLDCILEIISAVTSTLLFFPIYSMFYGIIGCLLGPVYFILLKNALPFYIFGNIFYLLGGICICYVIYFLFFKGKKVKIIITYIISIAMTIINIIIGSLLFKKKSFLYILINLFYSSIQGGAIGLVSAYLYYSKDLLEEGNNRVKCPLCEGNKYISKNQHEKYKRCNYCSKNKGYENCGDGFILQIRKFCKNCKGLGYIQDNK